MITTVKNEMNRISLRINGDPKIYLSYTDAETLANNILEAIKRGEVDYAE
jgi:hypothetical protein